MKKKPGYFKKLLKESIKKTYLNEQPSDDYSWAYSTPFGLCTDDEEEYECPNCRNIYVQFCPMPEWISDFGDIVLSNTINTSNPNLDSIPGNVEVNDYPVTWLPCKTINGETPTVDNIGDVIFVDINQEAEFAIQDAAGWGQVSQNPFMNAIYNNYDNANGPIFGTGLYATIIGIQPYCAPTTNAFDGLWEDGACPTGGDIGVTPAGDSCPEQDVPPQPRYTCTNCNGCQEDENGPFLFIEDCEQAGCVAASDFNFPVTLPNYDSFESFGQWCGRCLYEFTASQALHIEFPDYLPSCICCNQVSLTPGSDPEPEPEPETLDPTDKGAPLGQKDSEKQNLIKYNAYSKLY